MSKENADLVRAWWTEVMDWFNPPSDRDPERLTEISARYGAEDAVYVEDPVWPDASTYRGLDRVQERFIEYIDLLRIEGGELARVIDAGDLVFAEVRIDMRPSQSGEPLSFLWGYTINVENGKITYLRAWFDPEQALEAAGLSG